MGLHLASNQSPAAFLRAQF